MGGFDSVKGREKLGNYIVIKKCLKKDISEENEETKTNGPEMNSI